MPVLGSDSRSNIRSLIYQLVVGLQAYWHDRSVGCDSRRIGAISWSMYRMYIGTIIVCVGSSTVPATGSFGWQCNASNGVISVGVLARQLSYL